MDGDMNPKSHLELHQSTTSQFITKYGDVLIMPGLGHIELNTGKTFWGTRSSQTSMQVLSFVLRMIKMSSEEV